MKCGHPDVMENLIWSPSHKKYALKSKRFKLGRGIYANNVTFDLGGYWRCRRCANDAVNAHYHRRRAMGMSAREAGQINMESKRAREYRRSLRNRIARKQVQIKEIETWLSAQK